MQIPGTTLARAISTHGWVVLQRIVARRKGALMGVMDALTLILCVLKCIQVVATIWILMKKLS